jgi:hypothetical protein
MIKIHNIIVPIYFGTLQIVVTDNIKEAELKLKMEPIDSPISYCSYVISNPKPNGVSRYTIFIKPDASLNIIVHESLHIVNMIFNERGIKHDTINDEPSAYLLGWVTDQIYNTLNKYINDN